MGLTKFQKELLKNEEDFHKARLKTEEKIERRRMEHETKMEFYKNNKAHAKQLDEETVEHLNEISDKISNTKNVTSLVDRINELLNLWNELDSVKTYIYLDNGSGNNEKITLKSGEDRFELEKSYSLKDRIVTDLENVMATMAMPKSQEEVNDVLAFYKKLQTRKVSLDSCFKKYRNEVAESARQDFPDDVALQEMVDNFLGKPIDQDAGFFSKLWQKISNSIKKNS